ncbi:MAG: hypothetical protein U9R21_01485 [Candidatus Thermoplasmatota archaeon]|nr:hypothetical protein [Candidatus Thermoplasmatota archaeon]
MKVNPVAVKQWAIFGYPFSNNLHDDKLVYKKIQYNYDGRNIRQVVLELDELFTDIMYKIKDKYSDDTVFGLGLSGGMDSRLVLHYAIKADMNLELFNFGYSHPHKLLLSRDHKNSVVIAKHYGVATPKLIEFQNKPDEENFVKDCREHPFGSYPPMQFNIKDDDLPRFNVKLSGYDGGEWFGSSIPSNVFALDNENTINSIFNFSALRSSLFHNQGGWIDGLISKEEYIAIRERLHDFVSGFDNQIETIQSFLCGFLIGHRPDERYGECMYHHPLFLKETLSRDSEWLINRRLHREFFNQVHPFLSKIPNQSYHVPFGVRENAITRLWYFGWYVLRGNALRYRDVIGSDDFRSYAKTIFSTPNETFNELFDVRTIMDLPKHECSLIAQCVRIKKELDLLEGK